MESWENVGICEMFLSLDFYWGWVLYFGVYACFWVICDPLTNEYFITLCKKIRTLPFSYIVDPMSLKVIPTSFRQDTITTSLAHKPHTFIDITIRINHSALAMWFTIHPHTIVSISIFEEHRTSSFFLIIFPISCILSSKFAFSITDPECTLPMPFIIRPTTLVFVSILIILDSEPIFFIIFPVSYILMSTNPFIRFFRSILI